MAVGALLIAGAVGVPTAILVSRTQSPPSGGGSPGSPKGAATPTPSAGPAQARAVGLYREAMQAAEQSKGFHYVATSNGGGSTQTITGDAGQQDGTQQIAETTNYGSETFTLLLTSDQTVYFQGNSAALQDQLGVPASAASGLQGKWVSVALGDGPYDQLQLGITVGSQLQEDTFVPTAVTTVTGSGGSSLDRISGTLPAGQSAPSGGSAHLDVSATTHLPAAYAQSASASGVTDTATTTFSAWGTASSVNAPAGSVAWSSLGATQPPGGYGGGGVPSGQASPTPSPTPTPGGTL